jgi:hypothetical protein
MPEEETAAKGGAKRWRTVKLADGRSVRIAIVRKRGAPRSPTAGGPVQKDKKKGEK